MQPVHTHSTVERPPKRRRPEEAGRGVVAGCNQFTDSPQSGNDDRSGKRYGDSRVSGQSVLWQGDHNETKIHHHHYPQVTPQDLSRLLLESLTFERMDARLRNVAIALPDTCLWLPHHPSFLAWNDASQLSKHGGFLWIKGKPGSGKSTIMKATVEWAERAWPSHTILTYFFNARSPDALEKSSLGLYRSLTRQLLMAWPESQPLLAKRFASKVQLGKVVEEWTEIELQSFLRELLTASRPRDVTIFVDALDEGREDDVRSMVCFLENLTQRSISAGVLTRVCLSSRYFPNITIRAGISLALEQQAEHRHDIELYIDSQLPPDDHAHTIEIRHRVLDRSNGVFLWVVLVTNMLKKMCDRGKSSRLMLQKLDETPQDLHHVFANVLARDAEDLDECIILLRWMLYSRRPLSPTELYVAVQKGSSEDMHHESVLEQEKITKSLLNCSRGLIEATTAEPPVMQFIHETVRDFLLGRDVLEIIAVVSGDQPGAWSTFQASSCHKMMAKQCLRYLIHLGRSTTSVLPALTRYAAEYWWQHVQASHQPCDTETIALAYNLLSDETNLLMWIRHYNIEQPWQMFDEALGRDDLAPPVYYSASMGLVGVVDCFIKAGAEVNAQGGFFGNALQAASYKGHLEVVQLLLEEGANVNAQGGDLSNALQAASACGHLKVVQLLLKEGANVNAQGGHFGNALQMASGGGHLEVVQLLLEEGANVNAQGGHLGNALQAASVNGYLEVVQLLLKEGANVNAQGGHFGNALQAASAEGHLEVVQLLLKKGANVNAQGGHLGNALYAASSEGHLEVVQLLLEEGANVNAQGGHLGNALHAALTDRHFEVVKILRNHGACS